MRHAAWHRYYNRLWPDVCRCFSFSPSLPLESALRHFAKHRKAPPKKTLLFWARAGSRSVFVIRMPSGASTADRDLWQLITFCSLQVLDRTFYLHVLVCVVFFCMFLHISACSWRFPFVRFVPARPWHSANAAAEKQPQPEKNYARFHPNPSKIHQKSMQNPSETDHIGGQDRSESDLESNSASNNSPGSFRKQLLAPLGWFWPSFWAPPGAKGGAKIEHFGINEHQKSEIWGPGRGVGKSLKI